MGKATNRAYLENVGSNAVNALFDELQGKYPKDEDGIFVVDNSGYWSNLDKDENAKLVAALKTKSALEAIRESSFPELEKVIFSPKRAAGLELLKLKGTEVCVDFGCMWGALTIPLAKMSKAVIGVDQTRDSLRFLMSRAREEKLDNVATICHNLRDFPIVENKIDVAIVNGVLEWVPERGPIELKSHFGKRKSKENDYLQSPGEEQKAFLKKVHSNLKDDGRLYIAIENRYDFKMFLGAPDPHANILFASILPRSLANIWSLLRLKRPYVNWLYSFGEFKSLLLESGFKRVELYSCFPDYRFPERIIPYEQGIGDFNGTIETRNSLGRFQVKRVLARIAEVLIFKHLKMRSLAPSIIAIAHK